MEEQKRAILWLFENVGPMTDHELIWHYKRLRAQHGWPATQLDGVRKRRSDLKSEGRVYNTGSVAGFGGSPASIIWAATRTGATPGRQYVVHTDGDIHNAMRILRAVAGTATSHGRSCSCPSPDRHGGTPIKGEVAA